ncbi:MAG: hypothetical protein AB7F75_12850 [Planctomycetota bacterium]
MPPTPPRHRRPIPAVSRKTLWIRGIFMIGLLVVVSQTMNSIQRKYPRIDPAERPKREALYLPTEFDDSFHLDKSKLSQVKDFTNLDNDQKKWDRGFWVCLEQVQKLSPQELSRRAVTLDFVRFRDDAAYRESLRGEVVRVTGNYRPQKNVTVLPENPVGRQHMRIGVALHAIPEFFRNNIPEGYIIYSLDDSTVDYGDEIEAEGVFLKVLTYFGQDNSLRHLPLIIARQPKLVKKAPPPLKPNVSFFDQYSIPIGLGLVALSLIPIVWYFRRRSKAEEFRRDVMKKILEKGPDPLREKTD